MSGLVWAGAVVVWASAGCGSRIIAGNDTDALAVTTDDAAPNQRGSLDGGTDDVGPDVAVSDARGPDAARPDADARDGGAPDVTTPMDAPVRQCTAPAKRCDGKSPQTCSASGLWQANGTACQYACSAGDCTGVCVPGAFQCAGATRQICGPNGLWADYLACPFACVGTDCGGSCLPGHTQCVAGDLQTCSAMGAWQTTGVASRELLTNPAFEDGEDGWTNPGIPIVYPAPQSGDGNSTPDVAAQSPSNLAWFGGLNRADDRLSQDISIPADAASVTLSFYYAIVTKESSTTENDVVDVSVVTSTSDVIALAHLSDNNATSTWTKFTAAVPTSLAGQTVTLLFHGVTNATVITSFYIDTASVQAVACP